MFKIQCGCGHKIAVPDNYGGKRIKCPRCQGPLQVPGDASASAARPAPAAASRGRSAAVATRPAPVHAARPAPVAAAQAPTNDDIRHARMKRKAMENKRKSHNTMVAIIAGAMVLIGLTALLIVGMNNRPEALPVAQKDGETKSNKDETAGESPLDKLRTRREKAKTDTTGESTAASPATLAITTTSTFDANAGTTTLQSQASPFSVGGKSMTLTLKLVYDGKDLKTATQMTGLLRIKGDFTDLVSGANTDEPQLSMEIDGKEYDHKPAGQFGGDERKGENDIELLPTEVEYILDRTTLLALARGANVKSKLGTMEFGFSEDQMALFRSFDPSPKPAVQETPEKTEPAPANENTPAVDGEEKPAVKNDADEKEMEEAEMKKK